MTLLGISLLFAASAAGGAINSVAGGGTFLTFPMLIWSGESALQANIMSTIALWPGSLSSVYAYRRELIVDRRRLGEFMIISIIGSIIGTSILLLMPEATFERLVPWLLLGATLIFTFGNRVSGIRYRASGISNLFRYLIPDTRYLQFAIAIYGGYFGAGAGILMLAMLNMMGFASIHRMNALKTLLGSTINAVAVVIFIASGRVIWPLAVVMIGGAMIGGYVGARLALKVSPEKIRALVSIIGFAMTVYFFLK